MASVIVRLFAAAKASSASKAAFVGARMVISFAPSTVSTNLTFVRAATRRVRPAATAVLDADIGGVMTASIMCTTPLDTFAELVTMAFPRPKYRVTAGRATSARRVDAARPVFTKFLALAIAGSNTTPGRTW